jgi:hypothetical protein
MISQDTTESLMVRVIKFNRFLKYPRILETDVLFTKAVRKCLSLTIDLRRLSFYLDRRSQMSVSKNGTIFRGGRMKRPTSVISINGGGHLQGVRLQNSGQAC